MTNTSTSKSFKASLEDLRKKYSSNTPTTQAFKASLEDLKKKYSSNTLTEQQRLQANFEEAKRRSEPILTEFCKIQGYQIKSVEGTKEDLVGGVDYVLTMPDGTDVTYAYRLKVKPGYFNLMVRHHGAGGGRSEGQKIKDSDKEYKAVYYMQYEEPTRILRIFSVSSIREWLQPDYRCIHQGNEAGDKKSGFYKIPWSEIQLLHKYQL